MGGREVLELVDQQQPARPLGGARAPRRRRAAARSPAGSARRSRRRPRRASACAVLTGRRRRTRRRRRRRRPRPRRGRAARAGPAPSASTHRRQRVGVALRVALDQAAEQAADLALVDGAQLARPAGERCRRRSRWPGRSRSACGPAARAGRLVRSRISSWARLLKATRRDGSRRQRPAAQQVAGAFGEHPRLAASRPGR